MRRGFLEPNPSKIHRWNNQINIWKDALVPESQDMPHKRDIPEMEASNDTAHRQSRPKDSMDSHVCVVCSSSTRQTAHQTTNVWWWKQTPPYSVMAPWPFLSGFSICIHEDWNVPSCRLVVLVPRNNVLPNNTGLDNHNTHDHDGVLVLCVTVYGYIAARKSSNRKTAQERKIDDLQGAHNPLRKGHAHDRCATGIRRKDTRKRTSVRQFVKTHQDSRSKIHTTHTIISSRHGNHEPSKKKTPQPAHDTTTRAALVDPCRCQ